VSGIRDQGAGISKEREGLKNRSLGRGGGRAGKMVIFGGFYENCQDLNRYM
jgi:hypothetical protein